MDYPKTGEEWRKAIHNALGLAPDDGRKLYANHALPTDKIMTWLEERYLQTCGKNFIEALNRNKNGFISWLYGKGQEPYWPGRDEE